MLIKLRGRDIAEGKHALPLGSYHDKGSAAHHSSSPTRGRMPQQTMAGKAVAYLSAFQRCASAPVSSTTRMHWQNRQT